MPDCRRVRLPIRARRRSGPRSIRPIRIRCFSCCVPTGRAGTSFRVRWRRMKARSESIAVPLSGSGKASVKQRLREYLEAERPERITEEVWQALLGRLAPVSESYLRDLLRATGLPFDQPYAGVRQHTFEELEESLCGMLEVYREASARGNRDRARYCRRQVIAAKDRAKFMSASPQATAERQTVKAEMAQWMLVWLENPAVFPSWVEARKRLLARSAPEEIAG